MPVELFRNVNDVQKKYSKKGKDSSVPHRGLRPLQELSEPDYLARFHHTQTHGQPLTGLTTGPIPGIEEPIISTIKTIRKKN
jgi:hypothetical protein